MEDEKHLYDFKVIKNKIQHLPGNDSIYLTPGDLKSKIPQQRTAEQLLNLFHSHQFSFDPESAYHLFRRVAFVIPKDKKLGGELACTGEYKTRTLKDPRYSDKRMQSLLTTVGENLHQMNAV